MLPLPEQQQIIPTPMEEGIEMIRTTIRKYSNSIMQRCLPPNIGTGGSGPTNSWSRQDGCLEDLWLEGGCPSARTPPGDRRMDFQESVDYGMRHLTAKAKSKELAQAAKTDQTAPASRPHVL